MQKLVHRFERPKEPGKCRIEVCRRSPILAKITIPKMIRDGYNRRTHGPVLVRPLRPGHQALPIDPNGKPHTV